MSITLIQISDLHLGRSFGGLNLPPELRESLATASLGALRRSCELVIERDAAALLIPGDLFDKPEIDEGLTAQVRELFGDLGRPVLVSPGNHDAYGPMSVWNGAALIRLGLPAWPENVHVFATREFSAYESLDGELVVYGHRVEGYHAADESPVQSVELREGGRRHVLLMHGALHDARFAQRGTAPFTIEQLAAIGTDYAAVGHYHRFQRIEHEGRLLGAYAGVPVPGEWDEDPHGGIAVVALGDDGIEVSLETVFPGRVARLTVETDEPLAKLSATRSLVRKAAKREKLGEEDLVAVTLCGVCAFDLDTEDLVSALRDHFRHVLVVDETVPEVEASAKAVDERVTVERQFVAELEQRIAACTDDQQCVFLRAAQRYGLLALHGRALRPAAAHDAVEGGDNAD